jgi:hypothetical protein
MGTVLRVVVGVVGILIAVVVTDREATTEEVAPPPEPPAVAVPGPTEDLVLPPLISRRVISNPPGAELLRHGTVLGKTPLELELQQSDEAEPFTLRLAGYLEQTIELVPDQPGTTYVVLKREPQPALELGCDVECKVVLDGDVLGKTAPETPRSGLRIAGEILRGRPERNRARAAGFRLPRYPRFGTSRYTRARSRTTPLLSVQRPACVIVRDVQLPSAARW